MEKALYKIDDILKIKDGCLDNCGSFIHETNNIYVRIIEIIKSGGKEYYRYIGLDDNKNPTGNSCSICYKDKDLEPLKNNTAPCSKHSNLMNKITTFVKNLTLSADEKLMRKHGLKDDCDNVTEDGKIAILENFYNTVDNQAYLLSIATGLEADEVASK